MSRHSGNSSQLIAEHPVLRRLLVPRLPDLVPHKPTPKQAAFLLLWYREALYGGAAGGGKSEALLMAALQYVDVPGYAALLLRRTYRDLALPGALMDRAAQWLARSGARWSAAEKTWTFPAGATLTFGHLEHPGDRYRYQSSEFQFIGFDELTQFAEVEYTFLFSRLRRRAGSPIPLRMRSASNPGGIGHDWVRRRFLHEGPAHGRGFLPARLADNPHLDAAEYQESLAALDPLTRAQLLAGDWDADQESLLSHDVIVACQADSLWETRNAEFGTGNAELGTRSPQVASRAPRSLLRKSRCELYLGVDIGRTRDLSVIWTWERVGDVLWCREIACLAGARFAEQKDAIESRLAGRFPGLPRDRRALVVRCAIDRGGIGWQLAEELEHAHRGVVEGVVLSGGVQGRLARRLAIALAERKVRIPDDPILREDFRLVRPLRLVGGIERVRTDRSSVGHADRFWAAALGYDAFLSSPPPLPPAPLPLAAVPSIGGRGVRL